MNRAALQRAATAVEVYRKKMTTAEAVVARRRADLDKAVKDFVEAGGTVAEVARLLQVSRSAAQARIERARRS